MNSNSFFNNDILDFLDKFKFMNKNKNNSKIKNIKDGKEDENPIVNDIENENKNQAETKKDFEAFSYQASNSENKLKLISKSQKVSNYEKMNCFSKTKYNNVKLASDFRSSSLSKVKNRFNYYNNNESKQPFIKIKFVPKYSNRGVSNYNANSFFDTNCNSRGRNFSNRIHEKNYCAKFSLKNKQNSMTTFLLNDFSSKKDDLINEAVYQRRNQNKNKNFNININSNNNKNESSTRKNLKNEKQFHQKAV